MSPPAAVQCDLCPKRCVIPPSHSGDCRVRVNIDGRLRAVTYGRACTINIDPIEKKPLFHFRPGTRILSLATAGCNLHCKNCQNWEISQADPDTVKNFNGETWEPEKLVKLARRMGCPSIAYTYTDPVVFYEYVLDTSTKAKEAGLENVLVTAGYILPEPLKRLAPVVDAFKTDLKSFEEKFYREICGATLKPVLDGLVLTRELGIWLEVTTLVIPTLSDDPRMIRDMAAWIRTWLGEATPLHLSRFHPEHLLRNLPPTPVQTLEDARKAALDAGLKHVYIGNVMGHQGETTCCAACGVDLILRTGFTVTANRIKDGRCGSCGAVVEGRW